MQIPINSVSDIESLLLKLIRQGNIDDPDCVIAPTTVPNKEIKNFDSLTALEVLTEFEEETGFHFEEDIFYVDVQPKKYLAINEVALAIWSEIQKGGSDHA